MTDFLFRAIYINLKDNFYICYAKRDEDEENGEDIYYESNSYNDINKIFLIKSYNDWKDMELHFNKYVTNSDSDSDDDKNSEIDSNKKQNDIIKPTITSYPNRDSGYIDIVIKDKLMSLVFQSEMESKFSICELYPKICTGKTEQEFNKSFAELIENINWH